MIVLWGLVSCALFIITMTTLMNSISFVRLKATPSNPDMEYPSVSLLIPARDEAAVIGETLRRLCVQNYPAAEIIVLDDGSSDGTAEIVRQVAKGVQNLRLISGAPLPISWFGKSWACQQLAEQAEGDIIVFIDADVRWEIGGLSAVVSQMQSRQVDMLTVWPTQVMGTLAERLTVSLIMLVVIGYLPELAVRTIPGPLFAAANGQVIAFRRPAYDKLGGHAALRNQIVEDVALARRAKQSGLRLLMTLGNGQINARMYDGWSSVRDGFAKNILAGYGGPIPLLLSTVFHLLIFVAPWVWLLVGGGPFWPVWPLALIAAGVAVRAISAAVSRQPVIDALTMPISALIMTVIAARSLNWHIRRETQWKGRILHPSQEPPHD